MSKDLPQPQQQSEEVDLGQLFKLIGNMFDRLFKFIGGIFKAIFSVLIYTLKAVFVNLKLIAITMIIAGIFGFALQKLKQPVFSSKMLVKPYFDSKFQLVTNINYYNALIADKDYDQLGSLFEINDTLAEKLIEFEIFPGPENENDRVLEFEKFISQVDSTRADKIDFDSFLENRSIYSGDVYEIKVESFKKDIFRSLEKGLNSTFTNTYSIKKMRKRDSLIALDRNRIIRSLKEVDSLQQVYVKVLQDDANSGQGTITLKEGMSLVQERVKTKEFELLNKQLELREALSQLDAQKVEEDVFFDTLSSFQDVGSIESNIWTKYMFIFPIMAFVLLTLIYSLRKLVNFVKNYEE